ncbi:MAG: hypothetical protein IPP73_11750 [Chitinophagaceae bacterium]|nr:hypothetical protein [Chitinophagaceae bacterium]
MDLDHPIWPTLKNGYNLPYNAAWPLRKLKESAKPDVIQAVFDDLWENLHHGGNVGTASYLAVTQLVSICMEKNSFDWNYIGLCVVIENCRLEKHNPELPEEFQDLYLDSLDRFEKYLLLNFKNMSDRTSVRLTLSLLATLNGQPGLGKAIEKLDEGALTEFLEK